MSPLVLHRVSLLMFLTSILISTEAIAGHEESKSGLKACFDSRLADEKKKDNPKVESMVTSCRAEYDAFVADLPPGIRDQVMHDIRDQIKKKLQ